MYQLLPVYPCVDLGAGYQRVAEVACPASTRIVPAPRWRDFHRAIEAGVSPHDEGVYEIHSVVGLAQATKQSARWDGRRLVVLEQHGGEDMGGDGTVPRVSATPIETDDWQPTYQPMYSGDRHASLQNAEPVQTQLLGVLTCNEREGFRAVQGVRLDADELLAPGEPLVIRAVPDRANLTLLATVTDLATGRLVGDPCVAQGRRRRPSRRAGAAADRRLPPAGRGRRRQGRPCRSRARAGLRRRRPSAGRPPAVTLYALLVGIDDYPPPAPPLHGCRNDIDALADYLGARTGVDLQLEMLFDGEATRDGVIAAFRATSAVPERATSRCSPTPGTAARSRRRRRSPISSRPGASRP